MNDKAMKATVWNVAKTLESSLENILSLECPLDKKIVLLSRSIELTNNALYIASGETVDGFRMPPGSKEQHEKSKSEQEEVDDKIDEIEESLEEPKLKKVPAKKKPAKKKQKPKPEPEPEPEEEVDDDDGSCETCGGDGKVGRKKCKDCKGSGKVLPPEDDEDEDEDVVESEGDDEDEDEEPQTRKTRRKRVRRRRND